MNDNPATLGNRVVLCTRCGDQAAVSVTTRHFGPERVCELCAAVLRNDRQIISPQPDVAPPITR
jgi:hypothetical protein